MPGFQAMHDDPDVIELSRLPWNGVPVGIPLGVNERPAQLSGLGAPIQLPSDPSTWIIAIALLGVGIVAWEFIGASATEYKIRRIAKGKAWDYENDVIKRLRKKHRDLIDKVERGEFLEDDAKVVVP